MNKTKGINTILEGNEVTKGINENYNRFFKELEKNQQLNKMEYINTNYNSIYLFDVLFKRSMKELILKYNLDMTLLYDEDMKQEAILIIYDLVTNFKPIVKKEIINKVKPIKQVNHKTLEVEEVWIEVEELEEIEYNFKDCPSKLLFNRLTTRLRDKLKTIVFKQFETINKNISIESFNYSMDTGEFTHELENLNILNRLEDTASRLALDKVELLESIKGSLSKKQYAYILEYVEGKKAYDTRTIKSFRKAIESDKLDYDTKLNIVYSLQEEIHRLDNKLHRLGI